MGANDFITKDSGERAQFDSGMQRDTQAGKPRFDLMLPLGIPYEEQMITRLAALYGRGAEKYDERNWEQANSEEEMARMKSSAFRHFMQWMVGEKDEDHAAGAMFNIIAFETTAYKVDRNIDGLQPHELEAVAKIVDDLRAGMGSEVATSATSITVEPDGSDCEEVPRHTIDEWAAIDELVIVGGSYGTTHQVTRSAYEAVRDSWLTTRPMTSLEVARRDGRPY